jgi:hypothetical protein
LAIANGVKAQELLLPATSADEPREAWASLTGTGLLSLPDTRTLGAGRFSLGTTLDNHDRDPTRLDALDLSVAWTYGIKSRLETYGHAVVSRAVAVADRPTLLPPPVELMLSWNASPSAYGHHPPLALYGFRMSDAAR